MNVKQRDDQVSRLVDEVEELRTALEQAHQENAILARDRDTLAGRLAAQAREYMKAREAQERLSQALAEGARAELALEAQSQTEEELRVAFEELQVMSEELEASNESLRRINEDLDRRVDERTRELERVNAQLRASEAQFRLVADLIPDLLWRADQTGAARWWNKRWDEYTGQSQAVALDNGWIAALHPAERASILAAWREAVVGSAIFERECRIRGADGRYRWFLVRAAPILESSDAVGWYGAMTDIHEQRTAFEALADSELRFRTLIEGIPQLVWRARSGGLWTWSSPQWTSYTGLSDEISRGQGWLDALHPDDRAAARAAWTTAKDDQGPDFAARIYNAKEKTYRHFRTRATPVVTNRGHVIEWLGTSTDIDDNIRLESQQQVLLAELQHRTRNLIAVVRSLIDRTIATSHSFAEFRPRIADRLSALSRVQGLLSHRDQRVRVTVDEVLQAELAAHVEIGSNGVGPQVRLEGPGGIGLRSSTLQAFALAIHELTTNAVKYGAFSVSTGRVRVAWQITVSRQQRELRVEWCESGVPNVPSNETEAVGGGYGRELIERALPYQLNADTEFRFTAEGVYCAITLVLPAEQANVNQPG